MVVSSCGDAICDDKSVLVATVLKSSRVDIGLLDIVGNEDSSTSVLNVLMIVE